MAEGNGELVDDVGVKSDDRADGERTEDYPKLIEYGLDKRVRFLFGTLTNGIRNYRFLFFIGRRQIRRYL